MGNPYQLTPIIGKTDEILRPVRFAPEALGRCGNPGRNEDFGYGFMAECVVATDMPQANRTVRIFSLRRSCGHLKACFP